MTRPGSRGAGAVATLAAALLLVACEQSGGDLATSTTPPGATPGVVAAEESPTAGDTPDTVTLDPAPPGDAVLGEVERVVDGDTAVVLVDGDRERVRLLRIDTPELARDGAPAECLAAEATAALESLLPVGEPVLLATDVEARDRFGRLLAHVWTADTWVNAEMLRRGVAQVVTFPPNTAFGDEVLAAQRAARDAGVGLWDADACA